MRDGSTKIVTCTERSLGRGGKGNVYYAIDESNNKEYAVKKFNKELDYKCELELLLKVKN